MIRFTYIFAVVLMVSGCARQNAETSVSTDEAATAVVFNVAGDPIVEFSVPDMMCPEGCGEKTKEILSEQPGAKEVEIDFETKTATVAVEEEKFDAEAAIAALVDHGFEHSTLKSEVDHAEVSAAPVDQPAG